MNVLRRISENYIDCCVTSPPYYGLRDYGIDGQIGLEKSVDEYIYNLVGVFREIRRILRPDGTLWINISDTYSQRSRADGYIKRKELCLIPYRLMLELQKDGWYVRSFNNSGEVKRESHGNKENATGLRNRRSVWNVATQGYAKAHFATFPEKLIEPCILAGSRPGGIVLDPFIGSGTTAVVADKNGRDFIGIDLNPEYAEMSRKRIEELNRSETGKERT